MEKFKYNDKVFVKVDGIFWPGYISTVSTTGTRRITVSFIDEENTIDVRSTSKIKRLIDLNSEEISEIMKNGEGKLKRKHLRHLHAKFLGDFNKIKELNLDENDIIHSTQNLTGPLDDDDDNVIHSDHKSPDNDDVIQLNQKSVSKSTGSLDDNESCQGVDDDDIFPSQNLPSRCLVPDIDPVPQSTKSSDNDDVIQLKQKSVSKSTGSLHDNESCQGVDDDDDDDDIFPSQNLPSRCLVPDTDSVPQSTKSPDNVDVIQLNQKSVSKSTGSLHDNESCQGVDDDDDDDDDDIFPSQNLSFRCLVPDIDPVPQSTKSSDNDDVIQLNQKSVSKSTGSLHDNESCQGVDDDDDDDDIFPSQNLPSRCLVPDTDSVPQSTKSPDNVDVNQLNQKSVSKSTGSLHDNESCQGVDDDDDDDDDIFPSQNLPFRCLVPDIDPVPQSTKSSDNDDVIQLNQKSVSKSTGSLHDNESCQGVDDDDDDDIFPSQNLPSRCLVPDTDSVPQSTKSPDNVDVIQLNQKSVSKSTGSLHDNESCQGVDDDDDDDIFPSQNLPFRCLVPDIDPVPQSTKSSDNDDVIQLNQKSVSKSTGSLHDNESCQGVDDDDDDDDDDIFPSQNLPFRCLVPDIDPVPQSTKSSDNDDVIQLNQKSVSKSTGSLHDNESCQGVDDDDDDDIFPSQNLPFRCLVPDIDPVPQSTKSSDNDDVIQLNQKSVSKSTGSLHDNESCQGVDDDDDDDDDDIFPSQNLPFRCLVPDIGSVPQSTKSPDNDDVIQLNQKSASKSTGSLHDNESCQGVDDDDDDIFPFRCLVPDIGSVPQSTKSSDNDDVIQLNQKSVSKSTASLDSNESCQGDDDDDIFPSQSLPSIFLVPDETDPGLDQSNSDPDTHSEGSPSTWPSSNQESDYGDDSNADSDYSPVSDSASEDSDVIPILDIGAFRKRIEEDHRIFFKDHKEVFIRGIQKSTVGKNGQIKKSARVFSNKHSCLYCGVLVCKPVDHLERMHSDKKEISDLMEMKPKKTDSIDVRKEKNGIRQRNLQILRNKGNHKHNMGVKICGKGEIIPLRRPTRKSFYHLSDFGPCPNCLGWITDQSKHRYRCIAKGEKIESKGSLKTKSKILMGYYEGASNSLSKEVLTTMVQDECGKVATSDSLILELGNMWLRKSCKNKLRRANYTSTRMRAAARLLIELRKINATKRSMNEFLCPEMYETVIEGTIKVGGGEETNLDKPSTALKLGHDLQKMSDIKETNGIITKNDEQVREAKNFSKLLKKNWNERISAAACATLTERKFNKVVSLPSGEDLSKLADYLKKQISKIQVIKDRSSYRRAVELVETRLLTFNKRRPGELEAMSVECYKQRNVDADLKDFTKHLTPLEIELCKLYDVVNIRGKRGRKVPVLIPKECQFLMDMLADDAVRKSVDVADSPFLFANYGKGAVRAYDALENVMKDLKLENPKLIKSTLLRKYIATTTQVLNVSENQLHWITNHLGHTINVHKNFYRVMSSTIEKTKIAKLLLLAESGGLTKYHGKTIDEIDIESSVSEFFTEETFDDLQCTDDEKVMDVSDESNFLNKANKESKPNDTVDDSMLNKANKKRKSFNTVEAGPSKKTKSSTGSNIVEWTKESRNAYNETIGIQISQNGKMMKKKEILRMKKQHTLLKDIPYIKIKNKINSDLQRIKRHKLKALSK